MTKNETCRIIKFMAIFGLGSEAHLICRHPPVGAGCLLELCCSCLAVNRCCHWSDVVIDCGKSICDYLAIAWSEGIDTSNFVGMSGVGGHWYRSSHSDPADWRCT